ncbi:hypothetical protein R6Q59_002433 [Mikania micrantha]
MLPYQIAGNTGALGNDYHLVNEADDGGAAINEDIDGGGADVSKEIDDDEKAGGIRDAHIDNSSLRQQNMVFVDNVE